MHRHHIFLLCLTFFLGVVLECRAEDSATKRLTFSVAGGFDYSVSSIRASSSVITDTGGEIMSDLSANKDEIKALNNANSYRLEQQFVDIRVAYEAFKGVSVWCGIGAVTTSMRNSYKDEDYIHTKSASENPTFLLKGGISYQYSFKNGTFLSISPAIAWNRSGNNLLSFRQNDEAAIFYAYELKRNILRWDIPVIVGHTFGRWTPFMGVSYADYNISDNFKSTVSYIGKDYPIAISETYRSACKVNGIAGCSFSIADNLGIRLQGYFSRNIATQLALYFNI